MPDTLLFDSGNENDPFVFLLENVICIEEQSNNTLACYYKTNGKIIRYPTL